MAKSADKTVLQPGRGADQFMVRMPEGMRDYLANLAEKQGRSMNSLMVMALARFCAESTTGDIADPPSWEETRAQILDLQGAVKGLAEEIKALRADRKKARRP